MRLYNYLNDLDVLETNISRFDTEISGITSRTDEVGRGYAFVCINGLHTDGHGLIGVAAKKGASVIVTEKADGPVISSGLPYLRVASTRRALSLMCATHSGNPERQLSLTAVTGTNGKTSTCRLLAGIYERAGIFTETLGTLGGGLTTPDPEDMYPALRKAFDKGKKNVVMEASSHALQLDKLWGMEFKTAVFTNLTPEHLDFHLTMESYAKAKARLFASARTSVVNADDPYGRMMVDSAGGRVITYSIKDENADISACGYRLRGEQGIEYTLKTPEYSIGVESSLCGGFNVYNTLAAAAAAYACGLSPNEIREGIASVKNVDGRLERVDTGDAPISVYIDYAHSPDALQKVLECIRGFRKKHQRLILVFGCGGDRDRSKRRVMGQIASRLADLVIVTSDNSRSEKPSDIIGEIMKGIDKERPYTVIEDRRSAIEYAVSNASEGDIILLAGKGHEQYEIGMDGKRFFSEKQIAAGAVNKRFK